MSVLAGNSLATLSPIFETGLLPILPIQFSQQAQNKHAPFTCLTSASGNPVNSLHTVVKVIGLDHTHVHDIGDGAAGKVPGSGTRKIVQLE